MSSDRSIALLTGPDTYLDHVGVLCQILGIPLLVTEEATFLAAKEFYPNLDAHLVDMEDLSLEFLANNFDTIFQSGKFWNVELGELLALLYKKKMRFVFCPHGNSDKGFSLTAHVPQDLSLIYGKHMTDLLTSTGALQHISETLTTGNYRLPFYRAHKEFYDDLAQKRLGPHLHKDRKTILYAPTWHDGENPTSFFSSCEKILHELADEYNLIIKLHPFLEHFHPAETYSVLSRYENRQGRLFLTNFPAIYPILALADLYMGDFSSIGYDYLAFDRPMFFFGTKNKRPESTPGFFLHQCGLQIPEEGGIHLQTYLAENLSRATNDFSAKRKEIYDYAFGEEKCLETLKNEIFEKLKK